MRIFQPSKEIGIGFVPFSSLGQCFLMGTIDKNRKFETGDISGLIFWFKEEACVSNQALIDGIT
jgi:aryl-alcohol dehydrogenase-like predicted oxidoreductase